jgi:NADPH-dependent 7-cyano-7-deazaguanine reductase QueF-like protein
MLITNLDDLNVINSNVKDSDIKKIVLKETNQTLFKEVAEVKRTVKGSLYTANMAFIEVKLIGSYSLFGSDSIFLFICPC